MAGLETRMERLEDALRQRRRPVISGEHRRWMVDWRGNGPIDSLAHLNRLAKQDAPRISLRRRG